MSRAGWCVECRGAHSGRYSLLLPCTVAVTFCWLATLLCLLQILGALTLIVANQYMALFDSWLQDGSNAPLLFAASITCVLFMCPQPANRTPTFLQSSQLLGLALGICVGGRMAASGGFASLLPAGSLSSAWGFPTAAALAVKALLGFPIVIAVDVCTKQLLVTAVAALTGINTAKPFSEAQAPSKSKAAVQSPQRKKKEVWWPPAGNDVTSAAYAQPGFSKALSQRILAESFIRTSKYAVVAVTITHAVPVLHAALSLA